MSEFLNQDYVKFSKEIAKLSKTVFKIEGSVETNFKKHHKSTYSIALILTKLNKEVNEENKLVFLAEILSDLLTVTKISFLGFETPALIVLRRTIENFYNHIYYSDHPVEYEHLNNGKNEYTPIDKLKSYFDTHPKFFESDDPYLKEFNNSLFNEYHQLCKVVHSKGKDSMNLAKCLKDLTDNFEINDLLKLSINIELFIVYLLYKFHKNLKYTATEKAIITSIIPPNKRNHLNE
jgi:hypothetical protein